MTTPTPRVARTRKAAVEAMAKRRPKPRKAKAPSLKMPAETERMLREAFERAMGLAKRGRARFVYVVLAVDNDVVLSAHRAPGSSTAEFLGTLEVAKHAVAQEMKMGRRA